MRTYPNLANQLTVKCSMAELKRRGMTAVVSALPLNLLSQQQFVFKVIDELSNREMKPLVEDLLLYVGTNVGLPTAVEVSVGTLRAELRARAASAAARVEQLDARITGLETTLAEMEERRKSDHKALMAALANFGGGSRKRKDVKATK